MDEYDIDITLKAKLDLLDIHDYVSNVLSSPVTADELLDKLESGISTLSQMPQRNALERDPQLSYRNLRKLPIENHLVFYTVAEHDFCVMIVRVLYARRDWMNIL
jgi:addiction module RelE/StbE family toxin